MNELQVFNNEQFGDIRTIEENGNVLFCGSDVARALGYAVPRKALFDHCKGVLKRNTLTNGGEQEMSFIPEPDVYRLIVKSQLPAAEQFEKWVFDEVLPTIRKHGAYMTPQKIEEALLNPDAIIKIATALKDEREKRKALEADNTVMLPKAEYYDALVERNHLTNFRETAKLLKVPERAFIMVLLNSEYLYRNQRGCLMPYAKKNNGYFEVKEYVNERTGASGMQTLITVAGRKHLQKLFEKIA